MNEQEVCSILHGLAKMDAKWDNMSKALKDVYNIYIHIYII